jgi:hypothetical protein
MLVIGATELTTLSLSAGVLFTGALAGLEVVALVLLTEEQ